MQSASGRVRRAYQLLACSSRRWAADNESTTGAALAYYCAFSLAPLLVILLTIAGWILGQQSAYGEIDAQLDGLFGPATAKILLDAVKSSQQAHGVIATVTSVITLMLGATTVLAALQTALNQIWDSSRLVPRGIWGWIRSRFLSLGFILALGFLLLVSLTISTGLSHLQHRVASQHTALVGIIALLDFASSLVVVSSLFAVMFRYMPARRLPWRVVFVGGIVTAGLFDLGRWAIALYLAHSTQPSAFGAAASFAALLLWFYYTAQIFLFGAELTACLGGIRQEPGERMNPLEARPVDGEAARRPPRRRPYPTSSRARSP